MQLRENLAWTIIMGDENAISNYNKILSDFENDFINYAILSKNNDLNKNH